MCWHLIFFNLKKLNSKYFLTKLWSYDWNFNYELEIAVNYRDNTKGYDECKC